MVTENVALTGAVDDIRGLGVTVHQDHNGVRIDVGGIEIMLDADGTRDLITLLYTAIIDATLWHVTQNAHYVRDIPGFPRDDDETMDAALTDILTRPSDHDHDWHCMGCGADYDGDTALHICLPGGPRSE